MIATLTHVPLGLEIALIVVLALIALGGSALVVKGIFYDQIQQRKEITAQEPEQIDIWRGFDEAHNKYEKRGIPDVKPLSILDWLSSQQP